MDGGQGLLGIELQDTGRRRCAAQGRPVAVHMHAGRNAQQCTHARTHFVAQHQSVYQLPPVQLMHPRPNGRQSGHARAAVRAGMAFAGLVPTGRHRKGHGSPRAGSDLGGARCGKGIGAQVLSIQPGPHRWGSPTRDGTAQGVEHQPACLCVDLLRPLTPRLGEPFNQPLQMVFNQGVSRHVSSIGLHPKPWLLAWRPPECTFILG